MPTQHSSALLDIENPITHCLDEVDISETLSPVPETSSISETLKTTSRSRKSMYVMKYLYN